MKHAILVMALVMSYSSFSAEKKPSNSEASLLKRAPEFMNAMLKIDDSYSNFLHSLDRKSSYQTRREKALRKLSPSFYALNMGLGLTDSLKDLMLCCVKASESGELTLSPKDLKTLFLKVGTDTNFFTLIKNGKAVSRAISAQKIDIAEEFVYFFSEDQKEIELVFPRVDGCVPCWVLGRCSGFVVCLAWHKPHNDSFLLMDEGERKLNDLVVFLQAKEDQEGFDIAGDFVESLLNYRENAEKRRSSFDHKKKAITELISFACAGKFTKLGTSIVAKKLGVSLEDQHDLGDTDKSIDVRVLLRIDGSIDVTERK